MQIRDATGVSFATGAAPCRIVSLVPSLTEALFALGAGCRVAGVTRFCEQPAEDVAALPKVGGTKNPDLARVLSLLPDLVIASSEENRAEDVAALRTAGLPVFVTHYASVQDALSGIRDLAALAGADGAIWLDDAQRTMATLRAHPRRPVRYFCPIWRRPYMTARRDTYMADLLAVAGGEDALAGDGPLHYNAVALDDAMRAAPEIVLLPDEPYRFAARHRADFAPFVDVPAVAHRQIHLVDGKALTWYGPRIGPALRVFAALFDGARAAAGGAGHAA